MKNADFRPRRSVPKDSLPIPQPAPQVAPAPAVAPVQCPGVSKRGGKGVTGDFRTEVEVVRG